MQHKNGKTTLNICKITIFTKEKTAYLHNVTLPFYKKKQKTLYIISKIINNM